MEERPIIRLDNEIIGKIAAGEVVENPASAIKELVENSLDAGATCVTVEIRDGGITYLRVTDNGHGIRSRDVRLAFERHATSKIRKSEDLFNLRTLGFRGEALASIAAVSKLVLTTRHRAEETGTRAINEGGTFKSITEAASPQGTTIVARDLFFNTPVRLKFLKKPVTEAAKVADVIAKMILAHPDISFRLIHNGKQVYSSSGNGDLRSAVFCLYGREEANGMTPVHSEGAVSVNGLVGVGPNARSNRARQTFIVNGRTIRNPVLTQALEEGCRERVTIGHYPTCVLNIQMPVSMVDVNVHPNKLEVRFSDERLIFTSVSGAIADCFSASKLDAAPALSLNAERVVEKPAVNLVQIIDTQTEEGKEAARSFTAGKDYPLHAEPSATPVDVPRISPAFNSAAAKSDALPASDSVPASPAVNQEQHTQFSSFVTQYFGGAVLREASVSAPNSDIQFSKLPGSTASIETTVQQPEDVATTARPETPVPSQEAAFVHEPEQQSVLNAHDDNDLGAELSGYRMVGVAFDTYIILQNDKQMLFIDQHAAHERILYERLMREIDRGAGSQVLLVPQIVHVTPQDAAKIETYIQEIRDAGFDVEPFGDHAYTIRAVPNVLGVPQTRSAFLDMVDHLGELRVLSTQQKRRDAILQMACKKAIKGGDKLTMEEIKPLLMDMIRTNAPPTCPHGRPLVITLSKNDLEKRFRRIND
ncbi:MAG: DNA mismatch repair endonuclease MutL [Clostridia bacterium]|nr:DNA mismatch repair endonuclease MutL [Clostridia bacterium]